MNLKWIKIREITLRGVKQLKKRVRDSFDLLDFLIFFHDFLNFFFDFIDFSNFFFNDFHEYFDFFMI